MKGGSTRVLMQSRRLNHLNMIQWDCCGNVWQLVMSKRFPERRKWRPECQICKEYGLSWSTLELMELNDKIRIKGGYYE
jgi:hypothetical protein